MNLNVTSVVPIQFCAGWINLFLSTVLCAATAKWLLVLRLQWKDIALQSRYAQGTEHTLNSRLVF